MEKYILETKEYELDGNEDNNFLSLTNFNPEDEESFKNKQKNSEEKNDGKSQKNHNKKQIIILFLFMIDHMKRLKMDLQMIEGFILFQIEVFGMRIKIILIILGLTFMEELKINQVFIILK